MIWETLSYGNKTKFGESNILEMMSVATPIAGSFSPVSLSSPNASATLWLVFCQSLLTGLLSCWCHIIGSAGLFQLYSLHCNRQPNLELMSSSSKMVTAAFHKSHSSWRLSSSTKESYRPTMVQLHFPLAILLAVSRADLCRAAWHKAGQLSNDGSHCQSHPPLQPAPPTFRHPPPPSPCPTKLW